MLQTHAWGSWVYEISSTVANADGSTKLTFGKGGQQEARGTGSPQTGGGTFYLSHRKEFLDVAGEWYLDQDKDELSLAVAVGDKPPVELVASAVQQLIVVEGTQAVPVNDVRITGITFRHAAPTFMADQAVGSGGDYAVFLGGTVHLNGTWSRLFTRISLAFHSHSTHMSTHISLAFCSHCSRHLLTLHSPSAHISLAFCSHFSRCSPCVVCLIALAPRHTFGGVLPLRCDLTPPPRW
jgi:hypothetical protein